MTSHWDEFSKSLAEETLPRRESLRRLGIAVTATVLGPLGIAIARGGKPPQQGSGPCKAFCTCQDGAQKNQCLNACKACGNNPARLTGTCGSYSCCPTGQVSCGDYCADTANNVYHCGACGKVCAPPGQNEYVECVGGACVYACYDGAVDCNGECAYLGWDPNHCGACGNVCPQTKPHCYDGSCHECEPGLSWCSETCVD